VRESVIVRLAREPAPDAPTRLGSGQEPD